VRSLGLDIGARRIGVAISDPLGISASPLEVLEDTDPIELHGYMEEKVREGVEAVVVGLPLTCGGKEGEQARSTREYMDSIKKIEGINIIFWDERFSTREAERKLREAGRSPRGRRVDAEAAAVILQAYLDFERGEGGRRDRNDG
jgi:putative Holliday junction resolvase